MKKLSILLAVLLVFGSLAAFADDQAQPPSPADVQKAIDDVAALKAQPAIKATGSISFSMGSDTKPSTPDLPTFASSKSATATLTIGSSDDMATASLGLNLLAVPSVSTKGSIDWMAASDQYNAVTQATGGLNGITLPDYLSWMGIQDLITFYNGAYDDTDAADANLINQTTGLTDLLAVVNGNGTIGTVGELNSDSDGITLYTAIAPSDTIDTSADPPEFNFTDAVGAAMSTLYTAVKNEIASQMDAAVAKILSTGSSSINTISTWAGLAAYINSITTPTQFDSLTASDVALITEAVDYYTAFEDVYTNTYAEQYPLTVETTLTAPPFISSASFSLKKIAGVLDVAGNMSGQHTSVGGINLDASGHQSDTVKSYPSLGLSLSSGVVDGLTAGVTLYSDDNAAKNAVSAVADSWYKWTDTSVAAASPVEPKLGLKLNGGYTMAIGDSMSVGGSAAVGMYDLNGGSDMNFGFSVMPTFSGLGANVSAEIDSGLGIFYLGANADYTVMGITPSVTFVTVSQTGSDVYSYVKDSKWTSGKSAVLGAGGTLFGGGVSVDLSQFLPFAATVGGHLTYAMPTGVDNILGWDASLSVTPVDFLTVTGGASMPGVFEGDTTINAFGFNAGATATFDPFTFTAGLTSSYNKDKGGSFLGWNAGVSFKHSIATVSANASSAYDKDSAASYVKWSVGATMSF
jgi:hypothetical protein